MALKTGKFIGIAALAALLLSSGSSCAESLKAAVHEALDSHPEIAALGHNQQAISQELEAAKGLWMPKLDIEAKAGGYINEDTESERFELSAILSQPVFDGGRGSSETKRHRERVKSAKGRIADTANAVALRVAQAYTEVQRARAVLNASRQNLKALRNISYLVSRRASGGHGNRAETAQARARIASAKAAETEARQRLGDAYALYIAAVGRPPKKLTTRAAPVTNMPRSLNEAIRRARESSPKISALRHTALAAEAAIGTAKSALLPKFNVELSGNYANRIKYTSSRDIHGKALMVMRWNVFNGGIDTARVREAEYRASESKSLAYAALRNVERDIRFAWNARKAAMARVTYLRRQLAANRSALSAQKGQFTIGKRTLLDILDTQNEVFVSSTSLATAIFSARYNTYKVLAAMGQLVPSLNIALPSPGNS